MGIKDREQRYRFLLNNSSSIKIYQKENFRKQASAEIVDLSLSGLSLLVHDKLEVSPGLEFFIELNFQFQKKIVIEARVRRKVSNQQYSRYKKMTNKTNKLSFEFIQLKDKTKLILEEIIEKNFKK